MNDTSNNILGLPPEQQAIRDRCFHPSQTFIEFKPEEVEQSVSDRFVEQVRLYPNRLAVKTTYEEITFSELNHNANRVAHAISGGTAIDDGPVALMFEQGIELIIGLFGVLKSGRAFVPLNPSSPMARNRYMVKDVGTFDLNKQPKPVVSQ